MEQANLLRRQQLLEWRKATGRTPMKRKSYVQDYYKQSPQSTTKTIHMHQRSRLNHTTQDKHVSRPISKPVVGKKKENAPLTTTTPKLLLAGSASLQKKKLSRREMLDEWLALHGSTVKRPRSVLETNTTLNQRAACTEARPKKPLTTNTFNTPFSLKRGNKVKDQERLFSPHTLNKIKEQFQRDIDETVAEIHECGEAPLSPPQDTWTEYDCSSDQGVAKGLDYSELEDDHCEQSPTVSHKVRSRRSLAQLADPELIFNSSAIRYSMVLSEPRRKLKRRHTMSVSSPEGKSKRLVYLTPVRRSTRKNRQCPGLVHDQDLCVDSPGQLTRKEEYDDAQVEIVPNKALFFED